MPRPETKPEPARTAKPTPPARPRCALCGEPCAVTPLVMEPGWQVQDCATCGRNRRRASVAAERLEGR